MPGREGVLRLEARPARSGCDIPTEVSELLVDALESHGVGLCMCGLSRGKFAEGGRESGDLRLVSSAAGGRRTPDGESK